MWARICDAFRAVAASIARFLRRFARGKPRVEEEQPRFEEEQPRVEEEQPCVEQEQLADPSNLSGAERFDAQLRQARADAARRYARNGRAAVLAALLAPRGRPVQQDNELRRRPGVVNGLRLVNDQQEAANPERRVVIQVQPVLQQLQQLQQQQQQQQQSRAVGTLLIITGCVATCTLFGMIMGFSMGGHAVVETFKALVEEEGFLKELMTVAAKCKAEHATQA